MLFPQVFTIIFVIGLKLFLLMFLFSKYCSKVCFTGKFNVLCLAVRLSWVLLFVMHWAITGVLGCSVVLAYAVCGALGYNWGAWLFGCLGLCCLWCLVGLGWCLAVRLSWVVQFVGLGWAITRVLGCSVFVVVSVLVLCLVLGCSVVLSGSICGAWLGYNRVFTYI